MAEYVTVDQLRAEGVSADLSDARLHVLIQRASTMIDNWTHRWFVPREMTLLLDGKGSDILQIGPPIIAISEVKILVPDTTYIPTINEIVDLLSIRVFNRHLTEQLLDPDDRNNPKIQYVTSWYGTRLVPEVYPFSWFPVGVQNIQVKGIFGYTDYDGGVALATDGVTPVGKTPDMISLACMMLVVRDLLPLADLAGRNDQALASRVTQLRTRDQSISYGAQVGTSSGIGTSSNAPGIVGNSEIKAILEPYCRGGSLGAV